MSTNHYYYSNHYYSWHPTHRPPPAEPSLAGRIAALGPVGKCLETALDELLAEDRGGDCDGDDGDGAVVEENNESNHNKHIEEPSEGSSEKVKQPAEATATKGEDCREERSSGPGPADGSEAEGEKSNQEKDDNGSATSLTSDPDSSSIQLLDESISKSILEAYSNAVAETKFDHRSKKSTTRNNRPGITSDNNSRIDAPAAMLKGEIDHFNRVGGQWRIIVKNAVLNSRSLTKVDNGLPGKSCRKRTVLDWDDDDNSISNNSNSNNDGAQRKKRASSSDDDDDDDRSEDVHHFKGTIQILAYDDLTSNTHN